MEYKELESIQPWASDLQLLLINCVESGASVDFLTPINLQEIEFYWINVEKDLQSKNRKIFVALNGDRVVGAVQLSLCSKANGSHRGEVEKLMVMTHSRGQGIGKKLMMLMENTAKALGLSLLVLDTRLGDVASSLYRSIGYKESGQIPQFARSSNGELDATVYFYKLLSNP